MEVFDNVNNIVKDDLEKVVTRGSKISIAAACFSIYAFQELKKQLENIDELRFIFTSPTFIAEFKITCFIISLLSLFISFFIKFILSYLSFFFVFYFL